MQMPAFEKHVWAEIDLDALRHNFRAVKARAGEMPLCAVVKADTGMGRIGFALRTDFDAALAEMLDACRLPGLEVTGLFQHFAVADEGSADSVV